MLADRTLLGVTLAATFLSGGVAGFAVGGLGPDAAAARPGRAEYVYAAQLREAEAKGYTEEELDAWLAIHQDYLDAYQEWWQAFLETHQDSLDPHDNRYRERLEALEASVRERLGR